MEKECDIYCILCLNHFLIITLVLEIVEQQVYYTHPHFHNHQPKLLGEKEKTT